MILFSDRGCPFAHRVLALFDHLGCQPDLRESMFGEKPEGISQYSASGGVPLLVHGDLIFTESRVMLEHLAEVYEFEESYPEDLAARSLHRHAMAIVDDFLAPQLFARTDVDALRLDDALRALEIATVTVVAPQACLLVFHVAPIWLRFLLWHPTHAVTRAVQARDALCSWLDAAVQLGCLRRTAPDPTTHEEDMIRARQVLSLGVAPMQLIDS